MLTKTSRALLFLQGLFWLLMAGLYYQRFTTPIIAILLLIDALGFLVLFALYHKHNLFKLLALGYLAGNLLLTLTDEVGWMDIIYLLLAALNFVLIVVEIRSKKE